jgi:hypothetical protein
VSTTPPPEPRPEPGSATSASTPGGRGILPSNVDAAAPIEAPRPKRTLPWAVALVGLLGIVLGAAAVLLLVSPTSTQAPQRPAAAAAPTLSILPTQAPTVDPTRRGAASASASAGDVNGIPCDALESTVFHIHVHLAIFLDGREQLVPFGVGIGQPWQVTNSDEGPFVEDGACFYWIHTHTQDGVIHIESPVRRRFTLGDFFAIWQVPLSPTQVGPSQGPVITYVNGKRDDTNPSDIVLLAHERIQLNVGQDVPPYIFDFPPGD